MFAGYQKGNIVLVADTRKELESNKFMQFEEIRELPEPYELYKGQYIPAYEAIARRVADEKAALIKSLQDRLDSLDLKAIRPIRAKESGTATQEDLDRLAAIEAEVVEIRERLKELQD